ncbi:MAG: type II toxin-antitoxin system VapC family toxin [Nitrospinota bacterium]
MIVVDASAVLEVLLNISAAARLGQRLFAPGETLHAPHLLDLEVVQVLRRYAASGDLEHARGLQALEDLADFPVTRYPHDLFLPRIWELRHNVTAYDAAYLDWPKPSARLLSPGTPHWRRPPGTPRGSSSSEPL